MYTPYISNVIQKPGLLPIAAVSVSVGAPALGLHCLYREYTWKKGFLGRGTSDWSLSFEGLWVGS